MAFLYNESAKKNQRRSLRKNPTDAEKLVWSKLRSEQIQGLRFFRQYSVGPYILDFYCPKRRLAIEIDGGQHAAERKKLDEKRTKFLRQKDIKVLRFWNNDMLTNIEGVYDKIIEIINNS